MTMLTLGKAAKLAGVGKSTLARAIAAGRLSATKTEAGTYEIDTAELAGVYPLVAHGDAAGATGAAARPTARQAALEATNAALAAEVAGLRQVETLLRDQLADTKTDRDRWRDVAETAQRQLTDQRPRLPWWRRLGGGSGT